MADDPRTLPEHPWRPGFPHPDLWESDPTGDVWTHPVASRRTPEAVVSLLVALVHGLGEAAAVAANDVLAANWVADARGTTVRLPTGHAVYTAAQAEPVGTIPDPPPSAGAPVVTERAAPVDTTPAVAPDGRAPTAEHPGPHGPAEDYHGGGAPTARTRYPL